MSSLLEEAATFLLLIDDVHF